MLTGPDSGLAAAISVPWPAADLAALPIFSVIEAVVFGFTIAVHGRPAAPKPEPRAIVLTSAAFTSARYVAAARPRSTPFGDGSWVATTFDAVEGSELLDAAADGKFQIAYTRTRPVAARVYDVASAPPRDVLARLRGCVDGLQAVE